MGDWETGTLGHWVAWRLGLRTLGHCDTGRLRGWGMGGWDIKTLGHWRTGRLGRWEVGFDIGRLGHCEIWKLGAGMLGRWEAGVWGHWDIWGVGNRLGSCLCCLEDIHVGISGRIIFVLVIRLWTNHKNNVSKTNDNN